MWRLVNEWDIQLWPDDRQQNISTKVLFLQGLWQPNWNTNKFSIVVTLYRIILKYNNTIKQSPAPASTIQRNYGKEKPQR
jgi:hypothetical protein